MSNGKYETGNRKGNEIFIGKKPLMTYVTATLVQLANEPTVIIKARGKSITQGCRCRTNYSKKNGLSRISN